MLRRKYKQCHTLQCRLFKRRQIPIASGQRGRPPGSMITKVASFQKKTSAYLSAVGGTGGNSSISSGSL